MSQNHTNGQTTQTIIVKTARLLWIKDVANSFLEFLFKYLACLHRNVYLDFPFLKYFLLYILLPVTGLG